MVRNIACSCLKNWIRSQANRKKYASNSPVPCDNHAMTIK